MVYDSQGKEPIKVLVDADACPVPVRRVLERITRRHHMRLIFFTDENHEIFPAYGTVEKVAQGHDAVDYVLINWVQPGDIIVTQDYGLAALALSRQALAIHPSGMLYSDQNIDQLLMERHLASRARLAGIRTRNSKKHGSRQTPRFSEQLENLITQKQGGVDVSKEFGSCR